MRSARKLHRHLASFGGFASSSDPRVTLPAKGVGSGRVDARARLMKAGNRCWVTARWGARLASWVVRGGAQVDWVVRGSEGPLTL